MPASGGRRFTGFRALATTSSCETVRRSRAEANAAEPRVLFGPPVITSQFEPQRRHEMCQRRFDF
jgi:hypothetical protein